MGTRHPVILVTEHLSQSAIEWLQARSTLIRRSTDHPEFINNLAMANALIVRTYTTVDENLLEKAPGLKVVGRAGAGLDNIDVAACRARGIQVVYTPEANTQAVVEYVIALIFDAMRPCTSLNQPVDAATWNALRAETVGTRELRSVTLGILGLGRIGRRLAQVSHPLMRNILYHDLEEIPIEHRHGAEPVAVEELFSRADVISIHVDGREANLRFVSDRLISRMKPDVVLVNTSRGFVVDAQALADFLRLHPAATAMLDVHDPEPFGDDYPLLECPNARLFPHLASRTTAALENMSWVVRDVVAALEDRPPEHPAPVRR